MNDAAPTVPRDRAPFAGVAARDVVRDVLAVMALLVALPLPWDAAHRGTDRLEVVLATFLALATLAAPYALRSGMLPATWERFTTARARVLGCAPYAVVVAVYLVLDLVRPGDDSGGVGAGLALGLAGVALGAAPRWPHALTAATAVVGGLSLASPLLSAVDGAAGATVIGSVLNLVLVAGVLWLTAVALLRGDLVGGLVLLGVGAAVALELATLGGGSERPWLESAHAERIGLVLLPVVAAFAVPRVLDAARPAFARPEGNAGLWVAVAVRLLDLVILVAAFVALVALVRIVADGMRTVAEGVAVNLVLRIVVGVLMALVAVLARRALVRDPRGGHTTAVGAACVLVVLGLVIVVARSGVGTRSNVEELLVTFGLPAMVLAVLLVPPSVRELVSAGAAPVSGERRVTAAAAAVGADGSAASAPSAQGEQPAAWHAQGPSGPDTAPASAWRGAWAPADETQSLPPVGAVQEAPAERTQAMPPVSGPYPQAHHEQPYEPQPYEPQPGYGAWPGYEPEPGYPQAGGRDREPGPAVGQDADATQALPPVADVPGSRWTAAQALDPTTPLADLALIVQEAPHLRPHVAANPSTYPALLDWLGALGDPAVDAALRSRR
ncbi:hypothetical protein [Isoptericola variabilis]|uniref:Uncharacterized protein n=1 Tax=Isoptericola variabilis (strain 225) TaxID=743718 RepID=F6FXI0_ISOV2|nr:hypothetical protein [Isoptericola variabilis]AEG44708.1 hypothetical protein Isova_1971 [Isoptericola variabilis 225]TWH33433.1 hypothetical protein L600_001700000120 [Isoptericola variabilis J7]